jgi:hypothetical protein
LDIESVLQYSQLCLEGVNSYFNIGLKDGKAANLQIPSEISPYCQLLANQFVAQADLPVHILPELLACTFPLTDDGYKAPRLDVNALSGEYKAKVETEKKSAEYLKEIEEENNLLLKELHRVQEELEVYFFKNKDVSSEVDRLLEKIKEQDRKIKSIEWELGRAKTKIEQIRRSTSWKITGPIRVLKRSIYRNK